ncbi:histidine phosphatase family protein [Flavisphingomonas formosensis]|uniref:histidine phosphatase family protein n=1 Tax=Flavisphingomonas formosensis TaxID=861534 RepID=UPI0012F96AAC|nr:histidine phosphatase family protein [Sphingomonas formosensis]
MATRLILLCAGATASQRIGAFAAAEEPLDEGGRAKAAMRRIDGPAPARIYAAPTRAAAETAVAMGLAAETAPALADADAGAWAGRSLVDLHAADPERLMQWLADPAAGAPGGETLAAVVARVGVWLDERASEETTLLAIAPAAAIRAAIAHALDLPPPATLRIDVAPLGTAILSFNRLWRLQELRQA